MIRFRSLAETTFSSAGVSSANQKIRMEKFTLILFSILQQKMRC